MKVPKRKARRDVSDCEIFDLLHRVTQSNVLNMFSEEILNRWMLTFPHTARCQSVGGGLLRVAEFHRISMYIYHPLQMLRSDEGISPSFMDCLQSIQVLRRF